ncbi:MAG: NUDIX hydrolase [Phycisphaerae bacterium]
MTLPRDEHRNLLLGLVDRYSPIDDRDAENKQLAKRFIRGHVRCFDPQYEPGHLTGSAWLIDTTGTRVLLTLHRKLGRWIQLGGHADGELDLLVVATREAREESGILLIEAVSSEIFDVGVHAFAGDESAPGHVHYDVRFLLRVIGDDTFTPSDESIDLRWFTAEELHALDVDESVARMCVKWRRWNSATSQFSG